VVILHADTILPEAEIDRIITVLNDHPSVCIGWENRSIFMTGQWYLPGDGRKKDQKMRFWSSALLAIYFLQRIWGTPDVSGMYKKYYNLN
jgi:hypothetical protein